MSRPRRTSAVAWLALALAAPARGATPARELSDTLGTRFNPIGIQNALDLTWRWGLTGSKRTLLRDAHATAGLSNSVSPSSSRLALWLEVSPLSVLDLRGGIEPGLFHGIAGSLLGFEDRGAAYDEETRDLLKSEATARFVQRTFASATLKGRAGPIVAVVAGEVEWWRSSAPEPFFYEPGRDTLLASDGDRVLRSDVLVGYEKTGGAGRKLLLGLAHSVMAVRDAPGQRIEKAGVVGAWTLGSRRLGLREPTLFVGLHVFRDDPYKEDQLGAQAGLRFVLAR